VRKARRGPPKISIAEILSRPRTKCAFDELVAVGFPRGLLEAGLVLFANSCKVKPPYLARWKPRDVKRFVMRVVEWAKEIDTMNKRLDRGLFTGIRLPPQFLQLPRELGLYAIFLSSFEQFHYETRLHPRNEIKMLLVAASRLYTHSPHYGDLASLLTSALPEPEKEGDVSAPALLELAERHKDQIRELSERLKNLAPSFPRPRSLLKSRSRRKAASHR
jgi:hypothetical protein